MSDEIYYCNVRLTRGQVKCLRRAVQSGAGMPSLESVAWYEWKRLLDELRLLENSLEAEAVDE